MPTNIAKRPRPKALGSVSSLRLTGKFVTSVNIPERDIERMKVAMKRRNYSVNEQSKWIHEALIRFTNLLDHDFFYILDTDASPLNEESRPKSSPMVLRLPSEARDLIHHHVKRVERKEADLRGVQTRIIKSAIQFRVLMGF